jgi:hypothetical protein
MGAEFNPDKGHDPEEIHRLMAEDFGLQGRRFLHENESRETIQALGSLLSEHLLSQYVSPEKMRNLHPSVTEEIAEREAYSLSRGLLWNDIATMIEEGRPISMSDMDQVFAGTTMASREALVTICLGLGLRTSEILEKARALGWQSGPME